MAPSIAWTCSQAELVLLKPFWPRATKPLPWTLATMTAPRMRLGSYASLFPYRCFFDRMALRTSYLLLAFYATSGVSATRGVERWHLPAWFVRPGLQSTATRMQIHVCKNSWPSLEKLPCVLLRRDLWTFSCFSYGSDVPCLYDRAGRTCVSVYMYMHVIYVCIRPGISPTSPMPTAWCRGPLICTVGS